MRWVNLDTGNIAVFIVFHGIEPAGMLELQETALGEEDSRGAHSLTFEDEVVGHQLIGRPNALKRVQNVGYVVSVAASSQACTAVCRGQYVRETLRPETQG